MKDIKLGIAHASSTASYRITTPDEKGAYYFIGYLNFSGDVPLKTQQAIIEKLIEDSEEAHCGTCTCD